MLTKYTISKRQARCFLLEKHGLLNEFKFHNKEDIMHFIKQVGCIQFDPIDICGKNAELVLQSRFETFNKKILSELLYDDRRLVDYFDKNLSIFPVEDWPYFSYKRHYFNDYKRSKAEVESVIEDVLAYIHENVYASSKEINIREKVNWAWSDTSLGRAALETLYFRGELVVHHKKGTIKYYSLARDFIESSILNAPNPNKTHLEQVKWSLLRRIGAVGLIWNGPSDAWLGIDDMKAEHRKKAFDILIEENQLIELEVEDVNVPLYCLKQDQLLLESCISRYADSENLLNESILPRVSFLAALDNILWDRKLIKVLFNFDYKWEIYTPAAERKFGYYVLPILYKDQLIGRIEIVNQKKLKVLEIKKIWYEEGFKPDAQFKKNLKLAIKRFAKFNECTKIEF